MHSVFRFLQLQTARGDVICNCLATAGTGLCDLMK
jgi:hypothetical protein